MCVQSHDKDSYRGVVCFDAISTQRSEQELMIVVFSRSWADGVQFSCVFWFPPRRTWFPVSGGLRWFPLLAFAVSVTPFFWFPLPGGRFPLPGFRYPGLVSVTWFPLPPSTIP